MLMLCQILLRAKHAEAVLRDGYALSSSVELSSIVTFCTSKLSLFFTWKCTDFIIKSNGNVLDTTLIIKLCKQSFPSLFWWCQRLKWRIKSQASFKNQRVIQSRIKIQEKTQDMQELQEKHQDKYKKIFSKENIE